MAKRARSYVPVVRDYSKRSRRGPYVPKKRNRRTGGFLDHELKFKDMGQDATVLATSAGAVMSGLEIPPDGGFGCLNAILQEDGPQDRDGRKVAMKSIYVTGNIRTPNVINSAVALESTIVFIALVLDKQTNAAALNSEDVFVNPSADPKGCASPFRNLEFSTRFRVLAQTQITMPQLTMFGEGTNDDAGISGCHIPFKLFAKLDITTLYKAAPATIASIVDNSIHLIACVANTETNPTITFSSRLRFVG